MAQPGPDAAGDPGTAVHVPAYAWSWLQRSRPVLAEVAQRLTGAAASAGFVDTLRERFDADPFTRDVVLSAVADVAFGGRVPRSRPAGATWDRGLTWWAATLAGTTPAAFVAATATADAQPRLFDSPPVTAAASRSPRPAGAARRTARAGWDRQAVVAALRDLLAAAEGDRVPAADVRRLLAALDGDAAAAPEPPRQ